MKGSLLIALLLSLGAASYAQESATAEKGFAASKVYQFGDIDHVNVFSGNVIISLPIGLEYPLAGGMTYHLTLTNNSKVWDAKRVVEGILTTPSARSNAGLGWILSMGRLIPSTDPNNETNDWIFESPDGNDHQFVSTALYGNGGCSADCTWYTRDGSFLRLKQLSDTLRTVESPDGTIREFTKSATEWRLTAIRNRFSSSVTIAYPTPSSVTQCPGANLVWALSDSEARAHYVCFENQNVGGTSRPMVQRVVAEAFSGATETIVFGYTRRDVITSCENSAPYPTYANSYSVPTLTSVTFPTQTYTFDYYWTAADGCGRGAVKKMTLPTLGSINYAYSRWEVPPAEAPCLGWSLNYVGVESRTFKTPDDATVGTWLYTSAHTPRSGPNYVYTLNCGTVELPEYPSLYDEMTTTITQPSGDKTVHYFTVWPSNPGATYDQISPEGFEHKNYSLPLGKKDPATGTYLSHQTFDCDSAGANCSATPVRQAFLKFRLDPDERADLPWVHKTITAERTVFRDDPDGCGSAENPCRFIQHDFSDYDGFGHYRHEQTTDNFAGGPPTTRTAFTNFNPGTDEVGTVAQTSGPRLFRFVDTDAWVLGNYSDNYRTEAGATKYEQACFDSGTGFLRARRTMIGSIVDGHDLLSVFTTDSTGDLLAERYFGGDLHPLTTFETDLCTIAAATADPGPLGCHLTHTYSHGMRATSKYGSLAFKVLDRTIDRSGLVSATRDTAEVETTFDYDVEGRLETVTPTGAAGTSYTYGNASYGSSFTPAKVLVARTSTTQFNPQTEYSYDAFGRLSRESRLMPDGTWSSQETQYDGMGWTTAISEWETTPAHFTRSSNFDPFGRPRLVTGPDDKTTTITYTGARFSTRKVKVGTILNGTTVTETDSMTTEEADALGRLYKVTDPVSTTTYSYDVSGRLSAVSMTNDDGTQQRAFTYDNRGLLVSEVHPENGTVTYGGYDARGHLGTRLVNSATSIFDLQFDYDEAERLVKVKSRASYDPDVFLISKELIYAPENDGTNLRKGKLETAIRHNYGVPTGVLNDVTVSETFEYRDAAGHMTVKTTDITDDYAGYGVGSLHQQTSETFYYDDLGMLFQAGYPTCLLVDCGESAWTNLQSSHKYGFLTGVPGFGNAIGYAPSGMVQTVEHSNSVVDTQAPDPYGMARPSSITFGSISGCTARASRCLPRAKRSLPAHGPRFRSRRAERIR